MAGALSSQVRKDFSTNPEAVTSNFSDPAQVTNSPSTDENTKAGNFGTATHTPDQLNPGP